MPRRDDDDEPVIVRVELAKPRRPTAKERRVLEHLVCAPLAKKPGLKAQCDAVRVVAVCSCGCPSIFLDVAPSVPSVRYRKRETPDGRTDHVGLTAFQPARRGGITVTLHIVDGRLAELEIWAGFACRPRLQISKLQYA